MIASFIRRTTQRLLGRRTRCDKGRISRPRFLERDISLEMCVLPANHRGDHQLGPREPSGAATELTRHDQEHGIYQEDQ